MLEKNNAANDGIDNEDKCQVCGKSNCTDRSHTFVWIKNPKLFMKFRMLAMGLVLVVILIKCAVMYLNR